MEIVGFAMVAYTLAMVSDVVAMLTDSATMSVYTLAMLADVLAMLIGTATMSD